MKPVIKRGAALLAMIGVAFTVDRQAKAGVLGGFATEWTQLANNLQLDQFLPPAGTATDAGDSHGSRYGQEHRTTAVSGLRADHIRYRQFGAYRSRRPSDRLLDGQSRRGVPQPVSRLGLQLAALGTWTIGTGRRPASTQLSALFALPDCRGSNYRANRRCWIGFGSWRNPRMGGCRRFR